METNISFFRFIHIDLTDILRSVLNRFYKLPFFFKKIICKLIKTFNLNDTDAKKSAYNMNNNSG